MAGRELSLREAVHLGKAQIYGIPLGLFQSQLLFPLQVKNLETAKAGP